MINRSGRSLFSIVLLLVLAGCARKTMYDSASEGPPPPPPEPAPMFVEAEEAPFVPPDIGNPPAPVRPVPGQLRLNPDGIGESLVYPDDAAGDASSRYRGQQDCAAAPSLCAPAASIHSADDTPRRASEQPLSTFSIDVDTGSYSHVRSLLHRGQRPPVDAVRAEEFINYFDYDYPLPGSANPPFSVTTELAPAPWDARLQLLLVGLKGFEVPVSQLPKSNLVFLLDVSGSMDAPEKLPLLREALKLLVAQLDADDSVAIVVYAGAAGMVLPPTSGADKARILRALDALSAGGSTNGGQGIELAYALAREARIAGGINRVILATDGDFNVGISDVEVLKARIAEQRAYGIALTTLGFGRDNYNDALSEQLADVGNGNHYYIDSLNEARKVLVEQRGGTLLTIASDVKIQLEFNPRQVSEYRLIGYQNRVLAAQDFANDQKDAGEIGVGHAVTALYELALVGAGGEQLPAAPAIAGSATTPMPVAALAQLRLRYKTPGASRSQLLQSYIAADSSAPTQRLRFAAAVAGFAELLRGSAALAEFGYQGLAELAASSIGTDEFGHRREFLQLLQDTARCQACQPGP